MICGLKDSESAAKILEYLPDKWRLFDGNLLAPLKMENPLEDTCIEVQVDNAKKNGAVNPIIVTYFRNFGNTSLYLSDVNPIKYPVNRVRFFEGIYLSDSKLVKKVAAEYLRRGYHGAIKCWVHGQLSSKHGGTGIYQGIKINYDKVHLGWIDNNAGHKNYLEDVIKFIEQLNMERKDI